MKTSIASRNSYACFALSKLPEFTIARYTRAKHEPILQSHQRVFYKLTRFCQPSRVRSLYTIRPLTSRYKFVNHLHEIYRIIISKYVCLNIFERQLRPLLLHIQAGFRLRVKSLWHLIIYRFRQA